jgi:protein-tyrosine phosphatase
MASPLGKRLRVKDNEQQKTSPDRIGQASFRGSAMVRATVYFVSVAIAGRMAILPRPRGGDWLDEELVSLRQHGLDMLVSLLEDQEMHELDLADEARSCERADVRFLRMPIVDRDVPTSFAEVRRVVDKLVAELQAGRGVGIHCRQGVGRSSLLAACVLVACGLPLGDAWRALERARGCAVPDTVAQRDWVAHWVTRSGNLGSSN